MKITLDMLRDWCRTAPRDRKNPLNVNATSCLYTGPDGSHCIAGQFLADVGAAVPGYGDPLNNEITVGVLLLNLEISIERDAENRLELLQQIADVESGRLDHAWGYAIDQVFPELAQS